MRVNAEPALLTLWERHPRVALPNLTQPLSGLVTPGSGYWLDIVKYYLKDAGLVFGLLLAMAAFLWIAWMTLTKFNEARSGRAEWGEVGFTAIIAACVMAVIAYLLHEAALTI